MRQWLSINKCLIFCLLVPVCLYVCLTSQRCRLAVSQVSVSVLPSIHLSVKAAQMRHVYILYFRCFHFDRMGWKRKEEVIWLHLLRKLTVFTWQGLHKIENDAKKSKIGEEVLFWGGGGGLTKSLLHDKENSCHAILMCPDSLICSAIGFIQLTTFGHCSTLRWRESRHFT